MSDMFPVFPVHINPNLINENFWIKIISSFFFNIQVLASILFYLVAHCMKRTSETVFLQSMVQDAYQKAETIKEKVTIQKKNKLIPGTFLKLMLLLNFRNFVARSVMSNSIFTYVTAVIHPNDSTHFSCYK